MERVGHVDERCCENEEQRPRQRRKRRLCGSGGGLAHNCHGCCPRASIAVVAVAVALLLLLAAVSPPCCADAFYFAETAASSRRRLLHPIATRRKRQMRRCRQRATTSMIAVASAAFPSEESGKSNSNNNSSNKSSSNNIYQKQQRRRTTSVTPADRSDRSSSSSRSMAYSVALEAIQLLRRELKENENKTQRRGKQQQPQNSHAPALQTIQALFRIMSETASSSAQNQLSNEERLELSAAVDATVQDFTVAAFSSYPYTRQRRVEVVLAGVDAMYMQLSAASGLAAPYNTIPRRTLLSALSALTTTGIGSNIDEGGGLSRSLEESFRILQRLVTGVGVRSNSSSRGGESTSAASTVPLHEKDFTQVLNAFCKAGDMPMAHRIVALQERTAHAPRVSSVAYSVLLKGYGRLRDLRNVETVLQRAAANAIESDAIMLNTLIDAYINCDAMDKAEAVFSNMKEAARAGSGVKPNQRTYNTMLKGWAKQGALAQAQSLTTEMKQLKLWDSITTNTLVDAAVTADDFAFAEDVLAKHTAAANTDKTQSYRQHPNVEAYTELLDGYCKAGQLDRALAVLQMMQQRGVEPNEVTYTCLMGGLGRSCKVDQARKTFGYMESTGVRPTAKSYNAFISGLVASETNAVELMDDRVDEGMKVLRDMMHAGVRPNHVTVSVLVDALGRCRIPRVTEATLLVDTLERQRFIPAGNAKVVTALMRTCGKAGEIQGVLQAFQTLKTPDIVAVNTFLDACCRCKRDKLAWDAFEFYFRKKKNLSPDVISYSVLIGALLKLSTTESVKRARSVYQEMKTQGKILPDAGLVDMILKAMIRIGTSQRLNNQDVQFVACVLKDAELLNWEAGQLERRKRAVRAVLTDRLRDIWRNEDVLDSLIPLATSDDALFQRKGWNKVDSGFRLWGGGRTTAAESEVTKMDGADDNFLQSHGWNDVDSGFRFF